MNLTKNDHSIVMKFIKQTDWFNHIYFGGEGINALRLVEFALGSYQNRIAWNIRKEHK
jgi:hypothetical protein